MLNLTLTDIHDAVTPLFGSAALLSHSPFKHQNCIQDDLLQVYSTVSSSIKTIHTVLFPAATRLINGRNSKERQISVKRLHRTDKTHGAVFKSIKKTLRIKGNTKKSKDCQICLIRLLHVLVNERSRQSATRD